jgi:general secretion pathway protein I
MRGKLSCEGLKVFLLLFLQKKKKDSAFSEEKEAKRLLGPGASPAGERGFTLLEVLVAFIIASLAIGVLYEGTVSGLDATAVSARYDEAISLAHSHLDPIGHGAAIAVQRTSGADGDGFTWTLQIRRAGSRQMTLNDQDRANDIKPSVAVLYDVTVTESWKAGGHDRQVTLNTRRIDVHTAEGGT